MAGAGALSEQQEETTPAPLPDGLVTLPIETVARLDRLATSSLLAAGLAHEIANPLSCLVSALDALDARLEALRARGQAGGTDLAEVANDLELAQVSGNEMMTVVRDFQFFLRPCDPKTGAAVDLKGPILRAVRMARARLGSKSPVTVVMQDAPPVRIAAGRVTQIVLNLLLNAAEAIEHRSWSTNLIEVRLCTVEHWAVIEVKDNGPGIDPATRRQLFEPGVTGKSGRSLGLGLSICRELARAAGGDISVSAPLTGGSLFRVVLPPDGV
ncbi:MAG TPA: HAMP domain-containing sensor histidine kinase [Polyangia bacterium]|nr:HAMP domain-containing sensor histidine kinase [Polyangia bacterium]